MSADSINTLLDYWFGPLQQGFSTPPKRKLWYALNPVVDAEIRVHFAELVAAASRSELEHWREQPESCLAYLLLTDQFPRNIYRGSARAFASDGMALEAARAGIRSNLDRQLAYEQRGFFYMPFEHSEDMLDQHLSVGLYTQLRDETPSGYKHHTGNALRHAQKHRDVVQRFGRFPHRNAVLNRTSTTAELSYLEQANRYGQ